MFWQLAEATRNTLLFGIAMVGIMLWRPRGIISSREPSIVLNEKRAVSGQFVKEGRA